ncbi:MAG: enoyl-CoA hydratase/isomerase family protein [Sphingomonadales bacterium]|nr:enoyl-CoA hydratase/isomerase family protein [Sphingomonadales bacterium]
MSVEFTLADGVATILLNRPEKLNAITDAMWDQLAVHFDRCAADEAVRAVILTGAGRGFCAGADISGDGRKPRKGGLVGALDAMGDYNAVIGRLYHLDKPVIAAMRGPVVGIALTLALCCDWILVTETAKLRPVFLHLAKVPEGGIIHLMTRMIGELKTRDLIYRSRLLSGEEAVAIGLASRLVEDAGLMDEAGKLAAELAAGPPTAFALTKRLFRMPPTGFDQFVEAERTAIALAANLDDAREGMAAFREKRAAKYTGT